MVSVAMELKVQVATIEEELKKAVRKMQEARHLLPMMYQAIAILEGEDYIPLSRNGASRTDRILMLLAQTERAMRPVEIAQELDDDPKAIRTMLFYAKKRGLVKECAGHYQLPRLIEHNTARAKEAA